MTETTPEDPRAASPHRQAVGAVVLAAGTSRRAGPINKLLHLVDGEPMIRRVVRTTLDAELRPCVVVLGYDAERVRAALDDLSVRMVVNEAHAAGMGTSIARGVDAIASDVDATFIVLGDMPFVRAEDLLRLRAAFLAGPADPLMAPIVAPEAGRGASRRLGNPVLWPRRCFDSLRELDGDRGAKRLLLADPDAVARVPIEHPGVLRDVDTIPPGG